MLPALIEHYKVIGHVLSYKIDEKGIEFEIGAWKEINEQHLSFGFKALESYYSQGIRVISSLNILEVSFVELPAQEGTRCKKIL